MDDRRLAVFFLRLGLAFSLLYAAVASFLEPTNWIGFFPSFLRSFHIPDSLLLNSFSLLEAGIAGWLLWGRRLFWPALASGTLFAGIALFNLGAMDILFRDLSLFFAALALMQLSR